MPSTVTPYDTSYELRLDLQRHPLSEDNFNLRVYLFLTQFRIKDGTATGAKISNSVEKINFEALTNMLNDCLTDIERNAGTYITGLKIFYGITLSDDALENSSLEANSPLQLRLVYVPVFADQVTDINEELTEQFDFTSTSIEDANHIFSYDPALEEFISLDATAAADYLRKYREVVGQHMDADDNNPERVCSLKPIMKTYGDAKGCFISSQEINQVYLDYNNSHPGSPTDYLYFASATVYDSVNYPDKGMYRHSVEISAKEPIFDPLPSYLDDNGNLQVSFVITQLLNFLGFNNIQLLVEALGEPAANNALLKRINSFLTARYGGVFEEKAADMSNLCPPNCKSIRIVNREII